MAAPIYVLGRTMRCTLDDFEPAFYTRGWSDPEIDRTWIDGLEGELRFHMRRPAEPCTFRAEVMPFLAAGPQTLELFFNYFRVAYIELSEVTEITAIIQPELFILPITQILFHCRNATLGTTLGLDETRRLGIALRSWALD